MVQRFNEEVGSLVSSSSATNSLCGFERSPCFPVPQSAPIREEAGQCSGSQPFCPLDSAEVDLKNTDPQAYSGNSETSCSRWGLDLVI